MLIIYVNKNDDNDKSLAIALEIAIKKLELCLQSFKANSQEILNIFSTFYSFFEKKYFLE